MTPSQNWILGSEHELSTSKHRLSTNKHRLSTSEHEQARASTSKFPNFPMLGVSTQISSIL